MPVLSCAAVTCVYNENELCSKGDIKVGGSNATRPGETCCESFQERREGAMMDSMGNRCGCTNIGIDCEAHECVSNDKCKCVAGAITIEGDDACHKDETMCGSFRCK